MYNRHFGLNSQPFGKASDNRRFFDGGQRSNVLNALMDNISAGKGMVMVTGAEGAGKHTLCEMLVDKLSQSIEFIHLRNGGLGPTALTSALADSLGLPVGADTPCTTIRYQLQNYLLQAYRQGRRLAVIIEEAHRMPVESLVALRQLGDPDNGCFRLLYPVLIGRPELGQLIVNKNVFGDFAKTVKHFVLNPLSRAETREYLRFQLYRAGYCGRELFTLPAFEQLYRSSMGCFQALNRLADRAMFAAYAEGCRRVSWRHVYRSVNSPKTSKAEHLKEGLAGGLIACGLLAAVFLQLPSPYPGPADKPQTTIEQPDSQNIDELRRIALTLKPAAGLPIVSSRLKASQSWLQQAPADNLTIQLMLGENDLVELELRLANHAYADLLDDIYLYRSTIADRTHWHVLYGRFTNKRKALAALAALPDRIRSRQTGLRSLGAFRTSRPLAYPETYSQGQG